MYLDKLVPGRLTCVEVPPPKEKGGHTKVMISMQKPHMSFWILINGGIFDLSKVAALAQQEPPDFF
jgi:hypothetical protein